MTKFDVDPQIEELDDAQFVEEVVKMEDKDAARELVMQRIVGILR